MNDQNESEETEESSATTEKRLTDLLADPTLPARLEEMAALTKRLNELGITDALSMLATRLKKDDAVAGAEDPEWTDEEIAWLAEQHGFEDAMERLAEEAKTSDPGFTDRAAKLKARMAEGARVVASGSDEKV